jgi:hypothetical protein
MHLYIYIYSIFNKSTDCIAANNNITSTNNELKDQINSITPSSPTIIIESIIQHEKDTREYLKSVLEEQRYSFLNEFNSFIDKKETKENKDKNKNLIKTKSRNDKENINEIIKEKENNSINMKVNEIMKVVDHEDLLEKQLRGILLLLLLNNNNIKILIIINISLNHFN